YNAFGSSKSCSLDQKLCVSRRTYSTDASRDGDSDKTRDAMDDIDGPAATLASAFHNITQPSAVANGAFDALYEGEEFDTAWDAAPLHAPLTIYLLKFGRIADMIGDDLSAPPAVHHLTAKGKPFATFAAEVPDPSVGSFSWGVFRDADPRESDTYSVRLFSLLGDGTEPRSTSDEIFIRQVREEEAVPGTTATATSEDATARVKETTTATTGTTAIFAPTPGPGGGTGDNATWMTEDGLNPTTTSSDGEEEDLSGGVPGARQTAGIVGGVLGGVVVAFVVVGLLWWWRRRKFSAAEIKEHGEGNYADLPRDREGNPILDSICLGWSRLRSHSRRARAQTSTTVGFRGWHFARMGLGKKEEDGPVSADGLKRGKSVRDGLGQLKRWRSMNE
ncbi:hypothetical protein MKZ38_000773, partial [Zalerion maritima]